MALLSQEKNIMFYQGDKEARIKMEQSSIIVFYPEEAHRFLPSFHHQNIHLLQIMIPI
ncbi:MAG: YhcH/YjgK/YiaL family protein [Brevinema sp.]